ncbi:MAG: hypothetical protein HFE39_01995 [Clostridiales bacterium]|nr:hypothetical protein [Clostridiales bacterium]
MNLQVRSKRINTLPRNVGEYGNSYLFFLSLRSSQTHSPAAYTPTFHQLPVL